MFPRVLETPEGVARRAANAASRRKGGNARAAGPTSVVVRRRSVKAKPKGKAVARPVKSSGPKGKKSGPSRIEDSVVQSREITPVASTSGSISAVVTFDSSLLAAADRLLHDPSPTLFSLQNARIQVQSQIDLAAARMSVISWTHDQHEELAESLVERLDTEIWSLSA